MVLRANFEHELERLLARFEQMGGVVEESMNKLFRAVEEKDEKVLLELLKSDRTVIEMEREIESKCLLLITREQPVARDLREISASLKIVTDIKRVGDNVVDIAELLLRLRDANLFAISMYIPHMIEAVKKMFHNSIQAYINSDSAAAKMVIDADDEVDDYFNQAKQDIIIHLQKSSMDADQCVDILMLVKYLEKMGDHAVNIGEWTIFKDTGEVGNISLL